MLPQPNGAFDWVQASAGPALVCRPLQAAAPHLFTSRLWPLGRGGQGLGRDDGWDDVSRAMDASRDALVRLRQVHGAAVLVRRIANVRTDTGTARPGAGALPEADIAVSNDPGDVLTIQTADCVPLLLADPRTGAAAAAHAGWRGLAARVPIVAVKMLIDTFGSRPGELIAAVGPSIGACCYEVGEDVRARFIDAEFETAELGRWFGREARPTSRNPAHAAVRLAPDAREGRWCFDGWLASRDQLVSAGVAESRISVAELCTASHVETFCSYRRDGRNCGRMAAAIRPPGQCD